jgi:hypothetical protein
MVQDQSQGPFGGGGGKPEKSNGSAPWRVFEEAHDKFIRDLRDAWRPDVAQQRVADAHNEQARQPMTNPTDAASSAESWATYLRQLQNAWIPPETNARFVEIFRTYVQSIKRAFADLDTDAIDGHALYMIAQSVAAASSVLGPSVQMEISKQRKGA